MKYLNGLALVALALLMAGAPADAANFRWAADSDPGTMDPHSRNVTPTTSFLSNIYEPLVRRSREMKLEGALATSWASTGPDTWRFTLRKDVKFHDGSPFTADDVIFTVGRTRGPGSALAGVLASVADVRKIDDHTVDFVTKGSNPILPFEFLGWLMMSKKWAEANNVTQATNLASQQATYASTNANGTGPFKLKSRLADATATLEKNPGWWDKVEHNLDTVTFNPLANPATRVAALVSGEVDMIYGLPVSAVSQVQARPNLKVIKGPEMRTMYFGMDMSRPELIDGNIKGKNPFADKRVRQAMYQAIDMNAIKTKVMRNFAAPAGLVTSPGVHGYTPALDERQKFDVAAAKKLMADAGYPNGFGVTLDCPNDRYNNDEQICQAVAGMLAQIGIKVDLQARSKTLHFPKLQKKDSSFFLLGWGVPTLDSHYVFTFLYQTSDAAKKVGSWNFTGYSNAKLDELSDAMLKEVDQAKRDKMVADAWATVVADMPYLPMHHQLIVWAMSDKVTMPIFANDTPNFKYSKIK